VLAASLAKENSSNRVLVVSIDLRSSLGTQLPIRSELEPMARTAIVECAIFRDGGGACIIGCEELPGETAIATIVRHETMTVPHTLDLVRYSEANDAVIHLLIDSTLPIVVGDHCSTLIHRLLEGTDLKPSQLSYAAHSGGPRILRVLASALGTTEANFVSSWSFLHKHGNCSGGGNLAILAEELLGADIPPSEDGPSGEWICCLAMGPGVTLETLLLHRCVKKQPPPRDHKAEEPVDAKLPYP